MPRVGNVSRAPTLAVLRVQVQLSTSAEIASVVADDKEAYGGAMSTMIDREPEAPDELTELVEGIGNKGELKVGAEVQVVHDGVLKRARITDKKDEKYVVSVWVEVLVTNEPYQAGFETNGKFAPPIFLTLPRSKVYAKDKQRQELVMLATTHLHALLCCAPCRV